jgi:CheY-like chemotaxis protein
MKTILVVDDEFDLTSTLKAVLEGRGYRVETCSNGREALECVGEANPDLVLLDVMMPLGNGYEVVERLRELPHCRETPIILMNAVAPPDGRAVQWQAFLKKPLSIRSLLDTIERLIGAAVSAN